MFNIQNVHHHDSSILKLYYVHYIWWSIEDFIILVVFIYFFLLFLKNILTKLDIINMFQNVYCNIKTCIKNQINSLLEPNYIYMHFKWRNQGLNEAPRKGGGGIFQKYRNLGGVYKHGCSKMQRQPSPELLLMFDTIFSISSQFITFQIRSVALCCLSLSGNTPNYARRDLAE